MKLRLLLFLILIYGLAPARSGTAETRLFTPLTKVVLIFKENVQGLGKNFSGVDYVVSKNHFFIVDDSCKIFEIKIRDRKVVPVRTVVLDGFHDCEAVAHLPRQSRPGALRMAVAEEALGAVAIFDLEDGASQVSRVQIRTFQVAEMTTFWRKNSGLEAMTADSISDPPVFYLGKEEFPKRVYQGLPAGGEMTFMELWDAEKQLPRGSDIAELYFFEGKLLVLDQRGEKIRQVHPKTGELLSELKLPGIGWSKYEGLSVFRRGPKLLELMVVAEDHWVFFFEIRES
jgi:uncharacterized protein YjiK